MAYSQAVRQYYDLFTKGGWKHYLNNRKYTGCKTYCIIDTFGKYSVFQKFIKKYVIGNSFDSLIIPPCVVMAMAIIFQSYLNDTMVYVLSYSFIALFSRMLSGLILFKPKNEKE